MVLNRILNRALRMFSVSRRACDESNGDDPVADLTADAGRLISWL